MPPEQRDGYATHLELGEDNVSHVLETLPNNVAGWVEVCGDSPGKEYVVSKASYSVGLQLKGKNENPLEGSKLEKWHKRERSIYPGMHPAFIGNTTRTVLVGAISDFQVAPE